MAKKTNPRRRKSSPPEEESSPAPPVEVSTFKLVTPRLAQILVLFIALVVGLVPGDISSSFVKEQYGQDAAGACFLAGYFTFIAMSVLVTRSLVRRTVSIGVDGILVGNLWSKRFLRYARIRAVEHELPVFQHVDVTGYYRVQIELAGGEILNLPTKAPPEDRKAQIHHVHTNDPLGANLARALTEARGAWAAGRADQGLHEEVLARSGRSGAEWLAALRSLSANAPGAYRAVTIDVDRLWRLLEHPRALPSSRVAAAVVLGASSDAPARRKLRVAARAMVDPRLKRAVERAADAHDDEALIEALEAVERHDANRFLK